MIDKTVKIKKKNKIKCPTCKKETIEPFFPFCSKKCSDIDLLQWLSENNEDDSKKSDSTYH